MKLNKYLLGLAVVVMGAFSACNTDVEGEFYRSDFNNISFDVSSQSVAVSNTESSASIPVRVIRANTANAYTAHYTATANVDGIFSDDANGTINFAPGQEAAIINVSANNLEKEVGYIYKMTLSDADVATADTITNTQKSSITISVSREGDWNSLGKCQYREDYVTGFFSVDNLEYAVEVRESALNPGIYRIMNPYGEIYAYNDPGDWDESKNYFIEIDASDPDFVWVKTTELGFDWSYGMFSISSMVAYYMANGYTLDELKTAAPQYFGKLINGVISMPAGSLLISMAGYNDGSWYTTNSSGLFRLLLPGAVITDFSAALSYNGVFTNKEGETFAVGELELGPDAETATVLGLVVDGAADEGAVADALAAGDIEGTEVAAGTIYLPIAEELSGALKMVVAVINNGTVENVASCGFEYYGGGANPWKTLGKGLYTEDFVGPLFSQEAVTYEVEVQESTDNPGVYRMINPYGEAFPYNEPGDWDDSQDYNIIVNAADPEGVYIPEQSTGMDWGYGVISIMTMGADFLGEYPLETVKAAGYLGKLENGVITFPTFESQSGTLFQGYIGMGGKYYYGGKGNMKLVLPSAVSAAARKAAAKNVESLSNLFNKSFRGNQVKKSHKYMLLKRNLKVVK